MATYEWNLAPGAELGSDVGYYGIDPATGQPRFYKWSELSTPPQRLNYSSGELGVGSEGFQYIATPDMPERYYGPDEGFFEGLLSSIGSTLSDPGLMTVLGAAGLGGGLNTLFGAGGAAAADAGMAFGGESALQGSSYLGGGSAGLTPAAGSSLSVTGSGLNLNAPYDPTWGGTADPIASGLESGFPVIEGPPIAASPTINPLTGLPNEQAPAPVETMTPGQVPGTSAGASTSIDAIERIANGTATKSDWLKVFGAVAPSLLGAYGSSKQADSLASLVEKYAGYGAPSRARFEASMTPGFDPTTIPGYSGALDSASQAILAKLSATGGNPFGNPGGLIEANKAIVSGTALPAVSEYQRLNLAGGGLANLNAAIPGFETGAIGANTNIYHAFGAGLANIFNPPRSLADHLEILVKMMEKGASQRRNAVTGESPA